MVKCNIFTKYHKKWWNYQPPATLTMKRKYNKKRIIINIIAIGLMLTGPVLMLLPGPQLLS